MLGSNNPQIEHFDVKIDGHTGVLILRPNQLVSAAMVFVPKTEGLRPVPHRQPSSVLRRDLPGSNESAQRSPTGPPEGDRSTDPRKLFPYWQVNNSGASERGSSCHHARVLGYALADDARATT